MNITIYAVGKIKEKFYRQAMEEYEKRLGRYCKLKIVEVADEKTPDHASETENRQIKEKEGERLLKQMKNWIRLHFRKKSGHWVCMGSVILVL